MQTITWNSILEQAPVDERLLLLLYNNESKEFFWDTGITKTGEHELGDGFYFEIECDQFNLSGISNRGHLHLFGWAQIEVGITPPQVSIEEDFHYHINSAPENTVLEVSTVDSLSDETEFLIAVRKGNKISAINSPDVWDLFGFSCTNTKHRLISWRAATKLSFIRKASPVLEIAW